MGGKESRQALISPPEEIMRVREYKFRCPKCGCQLETTCPVCGQIAKAARMTVTELHNGGMNTIIRKLEFATLAIDRAGIEFDQQKLVSQTLEAATKAFTDKRIEELEDQFEENMKMIELKKQTEVEQLKKEIRQLEIDKEKQIAETISSINREKEQEKKSEIDKLNEAIIGLTEKNKDKEKLISDLDRENIRLRAELVINPARKGEKSEKDMATTLKLAFPGDEIIPSIKGREEIDIVQKVSYNKKIIGKVLVECKDVKQWNNKWITRTLEHMKRENTEFGIISTTVMPNETNLNPLGLVKEGILITSPENAKWAVGAFRLALIRSDSAMRNLQSERQRLLKQKEIKEKILSLIDSKDFETVFEACKSIKEKNQNIRNKANKARGEMSAISEDADSIDDVVDTVIRANTKLNEAFNSLSD